MTMELREPLVSVLMPVYNGMPDVVNSIKSLLWQTYKNWECVIVNDGSTDGTAAFLDGLLDKRFKIIHLPENKGRGYARQVCLENASGEYIAFLDADDWYDPEKLSMQVKYLDEKKDVALVSTGILSYGINCNIQRVRGMSNVESMCYCSKSSFICPAAMIRKEVTQGVAYNLQMNVGEDVDFFSRCLFNKKYAILNTVLYYYAEFDSVTVHKMQKYSEELWRKDKSVSHLIRFLFYRLVAPIIGTKVIVIMRGKTPTKSEKLRFQDLSLILSNVKLNVED